MSERSATQRLVDQFRGFGSSTQRKVWWRTLTDAQRWELFANCCWNCGALDPDSCKCCEGARKATP